MNNEELLARLRLEQERRGVLPNSVVARERRVRAFMVWMEPASVLEATREDVERYLDGLQIASATRGGYLSHFHAFFVMAKDDGLIDEIPTARIPRPRRRRRLPRPTADADISVALNGATGDLRIFLLLAAYEGLRCQEIAGIRGEDIDHVGQVLIVRHGKGERDRIVPLHPIVAEAIKDKPATGVMFRLSDGRPVKPHNISHWVSAHFGRLGISSSAHPLRHAFATAFYRMSQDLRLTQELLGHSSPATTAIYAGFDPAGATMVRSISFRSEVAVSDPPDAA